MPLPDAPHSGIVSVDELRAYMAQSSFSESQNYIAALTLSGVQQELETYLNRPIEPLQIREQLKSDEAGNINVSISPVHKVIFVEPTDAITPSPYDMPAPYTPPVSQRDPLIGPDGLVLDHLYAITNDPLIVPGGIYVGLIDQWYAVEYVGGYNGYVDNALKMDILRVAAREMARNHGKSINLRDGDATAANDPDNRPRGWSDQELLTWDRLRRRVIA